MLNMFLCIFTLAACSAAQDTALDLHKEASGFLSKGHFTESAELLQRLIDEYPDYYPSYSDYWESLIRVAGAETMREHVRASLLRFDQVPRDKRSEDFYLAAMEGSRRIEDKDGEEAFKVDVIERFPRGLTAQLVRLQLARDAVEPHKAQSLYKKYIDEFPDNKSWVMSAAQDCFELVTKHADMFTLDEMIEAADVFDQATAEYIPVYGNPTVRFHALVLISNAFLDRAPKLALEYGNRGLVYVAEMAPQTDEFDETISRNFDAIRFMAYSNLQRWTEARELAAKLIAHRGNQGLDLVRWLPFKEPQFLAKYSDALLAGGDLDAAHRQLSYAVALDPSLQKRYDQLCASHPPDIQQADSIRIEVKKFIEARSEDRKRRLLTQAQNRPAPHFALLDLEGNKVSLKDFHGKVVVLNLWATWCGPCIRELEEFNEAWTKYKDMPNIEFVAVSIDSDKKKVPAFVDKKGYRFRILLSNGHIEKDYVGGEGIPQLYIIDREGNIRFHKRGFSPEHFLEYLDWMIEAAQ